MHTMHTRAASIFHSWAEEQKSEHGDDSSVAGSDTAAAAAGGADNICDDETSSLWRRCWCPLLQGMYYHFV